MKPILIPLLLVSLLAAPVQASTYELINSQYGTIGDMLGIGDRVYKVTYDNGATSYQLSRSNFLNLRPGFITYLESNYKINPREYAEVPITITGISSVMDGATMHIHDIEVYDSASKLVRTEKGLEVNSGKEYVTSISLGQFNTVGVYKFIVREYVYLNGGAIRASGDVKEIILTVGTPATPTPTKTTPPPPPLATETPPPATETKGDILVWSSPTDAEVYLDNTYKGKTVDGDWFKLTVPTGTYEIKVIKSGYDIFSQKVTVTTPDYAKVQATLISLPGITQTGTPPLPPLSNNGNTGDTGSEEEEDDDEDDDDEGEEGMDSRILFAAVGVVLLIVIYFVTGSKK